MPVTGYRGPNVRGQERLMAVTGYKTDYRL